MPHVDLAKHACVRWASAVNKCPTDRPHTDDGCVPGGKLPIAQEFGCKRARTVVGGGNQSPVEHTNEVHESSIDWIGSPTPHIPFFLLVSIGCGLGDLVPHRLLLLAKHILCGRHVVDMQP